MSFYESPLFIELLLDTIYLLLAVTTVLSLWSALRSLNLRRRQNTDEKVKAGPIAWGIALFTVITLTLTALLADTTPITVNGKTYDDTLWLRLSDMLIYTSGIMLGIAVACVVAGTFGIGRHIRK